MTALGAGMGRSGGDCGVLGGALVAIGLLLGRDEPAASKEPAYEEARRFREAFRERFGTLACPSLIGFDLADPAERVRAREAGVLQSRCAVFLAWGAAWIEGLLARHPPGGADEADPGAKSQIPNFK